MEWFINDLSLQGQFSDPRAFQQCVLPMLQMMARRRDLRRHILCSRGLQMRAVTGSHNLQEAVRATRDQLFIRQILDWVSSSGPFWEADRAANDNDYFHFEGEDVTEQGLGEAARRLVNGLDAGSFSFVARAFQDFARTPLTVLHGLEEEPLGAYNVKNCWSIEDIEVAAVRAPQSWGDLLDTASNMTGLILSSEIASHLAPLAFHSGLAGKILTLLGVLQKLTDETNEQGLLTDAGMTTYRLYFTRHRPLFTDSSEREIRQFKHELTFRDPSDQTRKLFCTWHGKARFDHQYRIHFEWPRPAGQRQIKVVYVGKKITLD